MIAAIKDGAIKKLLIFCFLLRRLFRLLRQPQQPAEMAAEARRNGGRSSRFAAATEASLYDPKEIGLCVHVISKLCGLVSNLCSVSGSVLN